jgi:hypothetical protein
MPVITISVGSKIALGVIAVIALGAGGLSVAAAADTLPDPIITESPAPTDDPVDGDDEGDEGEDSDDGEEGEDGEDSEGTHGPDATGPAGFGLCTAYLAGGLRTVSTAYDSLSSAAGEGGIDAFCEVVIADKKGISDEDSEDSEDSDEKSGVKGKSGASETHGKPADKPAKPEKPASSDKGDKGDKGGNGGNGGSHRGGNGNGHNKH